MAAAAVSLLPSLVFFSPMTEAAAAGERIGSEGEGNESEDTGSGRSSEAPRAVSSRKKKGA
jgi:hypothetical protein